MKKSLVIVESPAKARTISKFLGPSYEVEASVGHIRDLPGDASEIPPKFKGKPWARIGVDVEHDFKPIYIVPEEKKAQVKKLKSLLQDASELFLATDEDREGEAIAWHLLEVLEPKSGVPVKRMVFHEITKTAIDDALKHPRQLDQQLVDAQEARRILDRLYGYEVSPVLWKKVRPRLSAGRVQSVAVRLIVDRERARMRFHKASYWDVDATLATRSEAKERVAARLLDLAGKRVASGKDFDPATGVLTDPSTIVLLGEAEARSLAESVKDKPFTVTSVTERPFTQRPYPPFITSTLQQESARKLRLSAKRTMGIAQELYQNGYITYMRTDSTNLSEQAVTAARSLVTEMYGAQFLPPEPRVYAKKVKGAQEAHEAIRPAGETFRTPEQLRSELDDDQFRLYDLIWKRTVASQMKDATGQRTTAQLRAESATHGPATFSATGKVIAFPGFLRAYVEGSDDPDAEIEDQEKVLPPLQEGQVLDALALDPKGHETQPPARYTEASLIKELEDRGIGRPSTYASIVQTIQDRDYVRKKGGTAFVPTFTAFAVTNLLERHFGELVDYDFTARMEDDLDTIAVGERKAVPWLHDFYFGHDKKTAGHTLADLGLKRIVAAGEDIDRKVSSIPVGTDSSGRPILVRVGGSGAYLQVDDTDLKANLPEDLPPDELSPDVVKKFLDRAAEGDRVLGNDPATGKPIYVKNGRYGPYVQVGQMEMLPGKNGKKKKPVDKPRTASLFPSMNPDTVTYDDALLLLSFPKELGKHPTTSEVVTAQDGQYGPYLRMGTETRSLENHQKLATVTLDEAVKYFEQPKQRRGMGGQRTLAEVGKHPKSDAPLRVMNGRFGAYVTDGVVNASLPRGREPGTLTVEQAVELLDAREAKLREMGKDPRAVKEKTVRRTIPRKAAAKTATEPTQPKARKAKKTGTKK